MTTQPDDRLLTAVEAAEIQGMKASTAYRRVSLARLKPVKLEGMYKYYRASDLFEALGPLRTDYDPPPWRLAAIAGAYACAKRTGRRKAFLIAFRKTNWKAAWAIWLSSKRFLKA